MEKITQNWNDAISDFRIFAETEKGRKKEILSQIEEVQENIISMGKEVIAIEQAQKIIQTVAQQTQEELKYNIEEIVTLALSAVFEDPYEFVIDFVQKRGRTEAKLLFKLGENMIDPLMASGGGPVDIAAFALRIAMWNIKHPRTRPIIILDEPFKFLSRDLQPKAGLMLSEISKKLGIQIIMVTHNEDLIDSADKVIRIKIFKGVSKVMED